MIKKAISLGIVGLFVISGLVGLISFLPDEVEGPGPTYVSGLISTNTTWTIADSPYIVIGNTLVETNYILSIEPGVEVKFDGQFYIQIDGKLLAEGIDGNMINFTSNNGSPVQGDWLGLKITSSGHNSVIKYCNIEYGGPGIDNAANNLEVSYCRILRNSADWGGIYNSGSINMFNNTISNNYADLRGGGITNEGTATIRNNTITENSAGDGGGGIYNTGNAVIEYNIICDNFANSDWGGGVYNFIFATANLDYNIITGNSAYDGNGGGVGNLGNMKLTNSTIKNNFAQGYGGGVMESDVNGGSTSILYCEISNNSAAYDNSGGIHGSPIISNSIITKNIGWGITGDGTIKNNTIICNTIGGIRGNPIKLEYNNIIHSILNINLTASPDVYAYFNWWGTINTTIIDEKIYDYYDHFSLGKVFYLPILTEPSPDAPDIPPDCGSGLQEGAPWPMFRGNIRHTGFSQYDTSWNPGKLNWSFENGFWIRASAAIGNDGTIYVGTDDFKFYAFNPNGTMKWNYTTGNTVRTSPAISSDGTIYVGSDDNKLYAFNPDGSLKWSFITGDSVRSSPTIGSDGTIYVGSSDWKLYAINPNGTEKWNFTTGDQIKSSPGIGTDGTIYIGSLDNKLYAIYPNGTEKWNYPFGFVVSYSSPTIGPDEIIYIGSEDNTFYAIYPNGTLKWNFPTGFHIWSSPAIDPDGVLYIGSQDYYVYAIYPNGTEKWRFNTGERVHSSPTIGNDGTIYIGSDDRKLYAIFPNGSEKWSFPTGQLIYSEPIIGADGTIYICSDKLYAIGEAPNRPPSTPPLPSGPSSGNINISYSFSTSTTDPDGDQIKYGWDWDGDGSVDEWSALLPSGSEDNRSHSWPSAGNKEIKVKARDEHGDESGWSNIHTITITSPPSNQPPLTPPAPAGPTSGNTNTSYQFNATTTDPDGDQIKYGWDWDSDGNVDEWSGFMNSGTEDNRAHSWPSPGIYNVKVKAQDELGTESGWSDPLAVTITSPPSPSASITLEMTANVTYAEPEEIILYSVFYNTSFTSGTTTVLNHQQLTLENEIQIHPSFSPDGSKIVYTSFEDSGGYRDIWIMDVDGTNHQQLTFEDYYQIFPSFSPDGSKIVYTSIEDSGGYRDIWIMDADGTNHQQLTFEDADQWFPRFNPSGSKIVYNSNEDGVIDYDDIWIMDADGNNHQQLTFDDEDQFYPSFSPDGNTIVYSSKEDGGSALDIWVINANGSNRQQLTFEYGNQYYPCYSPDGSKIVYCSREDYGIYNDIWMMNADGSYHQRLTNEDADQLWPSFSPDGSKIAYHSKEDGDSYYDVWILNMGSEPLENTIWINVTLPSEVTFISSNAEGNRTGDSRWTFYNVMTGEHTLVITVEVNKGILNGTTLTNHANLNCIYSGDNQVPSLSATFDIIVQYFNETEEIDTDGDGIPDSEDPDDDNDGYLDENDHFPLDSTRWDPLTEISIINFTASNENPSEGEVIIIGVDIENLDSRDNDVIIKFYLGNPNSGGTMIGTSQEVNIGPDSFLIYSQSWTAITGNHTLYVVIEHNETTETLTSSFQLQVLDETLPSLVLSLGDLNIYRFEPGEERTIFVEVTCYNKALNGVHLIVLDDQNLTIDSTVTPPRNMLEGETTKFYLRIRAPQLPEGKDKMEWDITIQAIGDGEIASNSEELDIVVSKDALSFFNPVILAGAVATGSLATLGAAAAASRRNENWKYLLLLSFAVPLYTRIHGKKTLDNFVRGQVFGHIQSQPGTHFNDIKKTLQLGNGNLAYHLQKLEKEGFIKSKRDKRYRRFYPVGVTVPEEDGIKLSKTQESILDYVEQHPHSTQKEISENLKESQQTISYNINVLVREGFMKEEKIKGIKKYTLIDENT